MDQKIATAATGLELQHLQMDCKWIRELQQQQRPDWGRNDYESQRRQVMKGVSLSRVESRLVLCSVAMYSIVMSIDKKEAAAGAAAG